MREYLKTFGWFLAIAVFFACTMTAAFGQPAAPSDSGIVSGTPTVGGNVLLGISTMLAGALLTFFTTKVLTKFPWLGGAKTVITASAIGMAVTWVLNWLATSALHLQTGITVAAGGLGNYVLASAIYHYQKDKGKGPIVAGGTDDTGKL